MARMSKGTSDVLHLFFFFFLIQALTFQTTILQNNLPVPITEKAIVLKYDNIVFNKGQSGTSKYEENKDKLHFSTYNVLHPPPPLIENSPYH